MTKILLCIFYPFQTTSKRLMVSNHKALGGGVPNSDSTTYKATFFMSSLREAAKKKVFVLMAGPLRPNPPSSCSMAVGTLEKRFQKKFCFLNSQALYPPHPPLNGPAIKKRTFFLASPNQTFCFANLTLGVGDLVQRTVDLAPTLKLVGARGLVT